MNSPLPNSYWVIAGRLLAGEHPYGMDEAEARVRLGRLRDAGINYFIDLTPDDEMPEYRHLLPAGTKYLRSAIADTDVPHDVAQMQEIQARIRAALTFGRCVYVHCRAGIGRTGTVVGCYLVEKGLDGKALDGKAALKQLNRLWRQSARAKSWPKVPQTPEQVEYILRWPGRRKSGEKTPPRTRRPLR
jgi:hypothetical protein